jgi:hypothetical protein
MTKQNTFYTHGVYMFSTIFQRWFEEGFMRYLPDGSGHIDTHSNIIGRFDGHIRILPIGSAPPEQSAKAPDDDRPFTHSALMLKKDGIGILSKKKIPMVRHPGWAGRQKFGAWISEGIARLEPDGTGDVYLHSTVIGGLHSQIRLVKPRKPLMADPDPPTPSEIEGEPEHYLEAMELRDQ